MFMAANLAVVYNRRLRDGCCESRFTSNTKNLIFVTASMFKIYKGL